MSGDVSSALVVLVGGPVGIAVIVGQVGTFTVAANAKEATLYVTSTSTIYRLFGPLVPTKETQNTADYCGQYGNHAYSSDRERAFHSIVNAE